MAEGGVGPSGGARGSAGTVTTKTGAAAGFGAAVPSRMTTKAASVEIGSLARTDNPALPGAPSAQSTHSYCFGCKRYIRSAYISALGGAWHPLCFVCSECKAPLAKGEVGEYGEQDGNPYCRRCFVRKLSPSCAKCCQPILDGKGVQASGRVYHTEHFTCVLCKKPITGGYSEHQGQVYCEPDFIRKFASQCALCLQSITEGASVAAVGKKFHPDCFRCSLCKCTLSNNPFAHRNGHLYCEADYLQHYAPRCANPSCAKPIVEGEIVSALNKTYHPGHFVCAHCNRVLCASASTVAGADGARAGMGGFVEKDGQAYCPEDWANLFCPKCRKCSLPILEGKVVRALGSDWHADHFRCVSCDALIGPLDQFSVSDGNQHCLKCYGEKFAQTCFVCSQSITGTGLQNFWGDVYCQSHDKEFPKCSSCGRLVFNSRMLKKFNRTTEGAGVDYEDGRVACQHCDNAAVRDPQTASEMMAKVYGTMAGIGVALPPVGQLQIKLMDRPTIRNVAMQSGCASHTAAPWGVTVAKETMVKAAAQQRAPVVTRVIEYIGVLNALPRTHFCSVLAHELCHVHLLTNGYDRMSTKDEEGLCELAKYLYLQTVQSPESKFLCRMLENNTDPVYGGGFVAAMAAFQQCQSFATVLAHAKVTKTLSAARFTKQSQAAALESVNGAASPKSGRSRRTSTQ